MKKSNKVIEAEKEKLARMEKQEVMLVSVEHDSLLPNLDADSFVKTFHYTD